MKAKWRLGGILAVIGAVIIGSLVATRDVTADAETGPFHQELAHFEDSIEACDQEPDCISEALAHFVDEQSRDAKAILARQDEIEAQLRSNDAFRGANDRYLQCMDSGEVSIPADLDAIDFDGIITFGNEPTDTSETYQLIEPLLDRERLNANRSGATENGPATEGASPQTEEGAVLDAVLKLNADCQTESGMQQLVSAVIEEQGILSGD